MSQTTVNRPNTRRHQSRASSGSASLRRTLSTLESAVTEIARCRTIDSAARAAATLAQSRIGAQAATAYLLDAMGLLSRVAIVGEDRDGKPIPRNWFSHEKHPPGSSITGRVLSPSLEPPDDQKQPGFTDPKRQFGRLRLWSRRDSFVPAQHSAEKYRDLLGSLDNAAGVPLNGPHRSFGVLEVLNKPGRGRPPTSFTEEDLFWLWHVATVLAARISFLRRRQELALLANVASELGEPYSGSFDESASFRRIAELLVSPAACFRVAVIRRALQDGKLKVVARAGAVDWSEWSDELSTSSQRAVKEAFKADQLLIVSNVLSNLERFENKAWLQTNCIRSYLCLPLRMPDRRLGTISLFTSFFYLPDEDDREFLENIQAVVSGLANAVSTLRQLEETQDRYENLQLAHLGQTRQVSYKTAIEQELHRFKNDFQQLLKALVPIERGEVTSRTTIKNALAAEIASAQTRIKEIEEQFKLSRFQAFNLNHVAQGLYREYMLRFGRRIDFALSIDPSVPDIEASEDDFREILSNLLVNAVAAVKESDSGGTVRVETSLVATADGEAIQLSVEDDGIGIPKEVQGLIYDREFTTRDDGTGMGLFITKRLVEKYLGEIRVDSKVGRGTRFTLLFPREPWEVDNE